MTCPRASLSASCGVAGQHQPPVLVDLGVGDVLVHLAARDAVDGGPDPHVALADPGRRRRAQVNARHGDRELSSLDWRLDGALGVSSQSPNRISTRTIAPPFDWYWTSTGRARPSARSISGARQLVARAERQARQRGAQLGDRRRLRAPLRARTRQIDAGHAQVGRRARRRRQRARLPVDGGARQSLLQGAVAIGARRARAQASASATAAAAISAARARATPTRSSRAASTRCRRPRG